MTMNDPIAAMSVEGEILAQLPVALHAHGTTGRSVHTCHVSDESTQTYHARHADTRAILPLPSPCTPYARPFTVYPSCPHPHLVQQHWGVHAIHKVSRPTSHRKRQGRGQSNVKARASSCCSDGLEMVAPWQN